jgi:hypothetical protein
MVELTIFTRFCLIVSMTEELSLRRPKISAIVAECLLKVLSLFLKTGGIISFCSVIHKNLLTDDSLSIEDPG